MNIDIEQEGLIVRMVESRKPASKENSNDAQPRAEYSDGLRCMGWRCSI